MDRPATLAEFIDIACTKYGCREVTVQLMSPRGPVVSRCLVRINGNPLRAVLPNVAPDTPLRAWQIDALCRALGLPAHAFGLLIG